MAFSLGKTVWQVTQEVWYFRAKAGKALAGAARPRRRATAANLRKKDQCLGFDAGFMGFSRLGGINMEKGGTASGPPLPGKRTNLSGEVSPER
jgi:hypothetical protein